MGLGFRVLRLGATFFFNVAVGVGCRLGTALPQEQSRLGVLLRAVYNPIISIIQLFTEGGQYPRCRLVLGV